MRRAILLAFTIFTLNTATARSQDGSEAAVVAAQEQRWLQSQQANNPKPLYSLLADNFVDTGSDGKVTDKTGEIAQARSSKWLSVHYNSVKVAVYGDVAIATGAIEGKHVDGSGKLTDIKQRWTDTWVRTPNGLWQCVASQATNIQ